MNHDSLMRGSDADRLLQGAVAQAQAQQQAQQQLTRMLQQALTAPLSVRRLNVNAIAIDRDEDSQVLMVGLPTGERIDIPLSAPGIGYLLKALGASEPDTEPTA